MADPEFSPEFSGLDARRKQDLLDRYEKLLKILDSGLESKKRIRRPDGLECEKCGCKHVWYGEVEDIGTAIKAAEWFENRALGKPATAESEKDDEKVTIIRKVIYQGAEDAEDEHTN